LRKLHRLASFLALLGLGVTAAFADFSGSMNFSSGGNLPVQAALTASRYANGSDLTSVNLITNGYFDNIVDPHTFALPDNGAFTGEFSGKGVRTNDGKSFSGSFTLTDSGVFSLDFTSGNNPSGTGYDGASSFILTLQGLLPENGSLVQGFDFIGGSEDFFNHVRFDFSGATDGAVVISGNLPLNASFFGTFTGTSPIPEPATVALGLAAAAGLFAMWRRRKPAA